MHICTFLDLEKERERGVGSKQCASVLEKFSQLILRGVFRVHRTASHVKLPSGMKCVSHHVTLLAY